MLILDISKIIDIFLISIIILNKKSVICNVYITNYAP